MEKVTFERLPEVIGWILEKLDSIDNALQAINDYQHPDKEELFTISEASDFINLAKPTIYGLVSRNEIPHSKKGKRLYFSKQELLSWIKSGRRKTVSELKVEAENMINRKEP